MGLQEFLHVSQVGIETAIWVSAPILVIGLLAGLAVSIFQAATQINDAALAFIPKIGATVVALLLFGSFMIGRLADFTIWTYTKIAEVTP